MARIRMVTRTVKGTRASVLCLDTETANAITIDFEIGGTYPDNEKLLKALQKEHGNGIIKLVHIVETEEIEQLYGMPESDFMFYAQKLPPRGSSNDDSEEV